MAGLVPFTARATGGAVVPMPTKPVEPLIFIREIKLMLRGLDILLLTQLFDHLR